MATKADAKPGQPPEPVKGETPLHSIGDLAAELGISTRAIRFYESKGLIAPERVGGNRIYKTRDHARLSLILRGKRLGFSLDEIAEYLDLYDADPNQIAQTRRLLHKVETSMAELEGKRRDIEAALGDLAEIRAQCIELLKAQNSG